MLTYSRMAFIPPNKDGKSVTKVIHGVVTSCLMSFSSDQVTGTVFPHLNMPFPPNSKFIYLNCPRGEALIISHLRFSSNEVASHVKQLPFRPLLLLLVCGCACVWTMSKICVKEVC